MEGEPDCRIARLNRGVTVELGVDGERANNAEIENAPVKSCLAYNLSGSEAGSSKRNEKKCTC